MGCRSHITNFKGLIGLTLHYGVVRLKTNTVIFFTLICNHGLFYILQLCFKPQQPIAFLQTQNQCCWWGLVRWELLPKCLGAWVSLEKLCSRAGPVCPPRLPPNDPLSSSKFCHPWAKRPQDEYFFLNTLSKVDNWVQWITQSTVDNTEYYG